MIYALCFFAGCFLGILIMALRQGAEKLEREHNEAMAHFLTEGKDGDRRAMQADFNHLGDSGDAYFCDPDVARICAKHRRAGQLNASSEK